MADTAQPATAAETAPVSRDDQIASAADAFKVMLGQAEAPEKARDDRGRFVGSEPAAESEEIEAEAPAEAESHEAEDEDNDAAEEAQRSETPLPTSWPAEQAEQWEALPPETQAFIAEREGQRDAAVNAKFQEAANVRRAYEQGLTEAQTNRNQALQTLDIALQLLQPQQPSITMLDPNSSDYDPDSYHLAKAQFERSSQYVQQLAYQRQQLAAQAQQEQGRADAIRLHQINQAHAPELLKLVPDFADQAKAPAVIQGLMEYAIKEGIPADAFDTPLSAVEWKLAWKAREYDKLQEAKGKVETTPAPAPKKVTPAVRPGVATPPSARAAARRQQAMDRLGRSGSVEDGAAVWKQLLKG